VDTSILFSAALRGRGRIRNEEEDVGVTNDDKTLLDSGDMYFETTIITIVGYIHCLPASALVFRRY